MEPDTQFIEYVRSHLGQSEHPSKSERQAGYARAQEALRDYYWEKGHSKAEWAAADADLQKAIAYVEGKYTASLIDRVSDKVKELWGPASKVYFVISAVLTSVSDFLKPILNFSWLLAIGSGGALMVFLILMKRSPEQRPRYLGTASFCGVLFLCSTGWWGLQKVVPGANANGVIAKIVPGAPAGESHMT